MSGFNLVKSVSAVAISLMTASCSMTTGSISPATEMLSHSTAPVASLLARLDGAKTRVPIGADEFCRAVVGNCPSLEALKQQFGRSSVSASLQDLSELNVVTNMSYQPMTDQEIYGQEEVWAYPTDRADCEDYALQKRRELLKKGIPADDMSIAVVRQKNGEGHAILLVALKDDVYVLDNLRDDVVTMNAAQREYTFVKHSRDLMNWFDIAAPQPVQTAQAKP